MAFTLYAYNHLMREGWRGTWEPANSPDMRINLYTSFTFNPAHTTKAAAETGATQLATANGYTQNAKTISGFTIEVYATTGIIVNSNPIIWWPSSGQSLAARYAMFYANGTTGLKPFAYLDFGTTQSIAAPQPFIIAPPEGSNWFTDNWT